MKEGCELSYGDVVSVLRRETGVSLALKRSEKVSLFALFSTMTLAWKPATVWINASLPWGKDQQLCEYVYEKEIESHFIYLFHTSD